NSLACQRKTPLSPAGKKLLSPLPRETTLSPLPERNSSLLPERNSSFLCREKLLSLPLPESNAPLSPCGRGAGGEGFDQLSTVSVAPSRTWRMWADSSSASTGLWKTRHELMEAQRGVTFIVSPLSTTAGISRCCSSRSFSIRSAPLREA